LSEDRIPGGDRAFGELAWQPFFPDRALDADLEKDLGAALKFSTGLRYTWDL
jgi:hypothetical protein